MKLLPPEPASTASRLIFTTLGSGSPGADADLGYDYIGYQQIEFLKLTKDKAVWLAAYHPILGAPAAAAEPHDLELIERLGGIQAERIWVSEALELLLRFLDVIIGRYRLYHATVAEFLTAPDTKSSTETADLDVDAVRLHGQIATYYWTKRRHKRASVVPVTNLALRGNNRPKSGRTAPI